MMKARRGSALPLCLFLALIPPALGAQDDEPQDPNVHIDEAAFEGLEYRHTGFNRGGRSTAVAGIPGDPLTYYAGYTGGGVWKTSDAGISWENLSDGSFNVASIGDIKVAPSDPNVLYVGTGSGCPRGNISVGDGIYKSTDAGKNLVARLPARLRADPGDGNPPGEPGHRLRRGARRRLRAERRARPLQDDRRRCDLGAHPLRLRRDRLQRHRDGSVEPAHPLRLGVERLSQAVDDSLGQRGRRHLAQQGRRRHLGEARGRPAQGHGRQDRRRHLAGRSPTVSGRWSRRRNRIGGVYRSDDGGDTWRPQSKERKLLQRAWYYIHIFADPVDEDTVYAMNTGFYKSIDGGKTFSVTFQPRHGDNHDLWINPENPQYQVSGNDGGANVSLNGGQTFSEQMNQPTAEFYRVTVDNASPTTSTAPSRTTRPRRWRRSVVAAASSAAAVPTSSRSAAARAATSPSIRATTR